MVRFVSVLILLDTSKANPCEFRLKKVLSYIHIEQKRNRNRFRQGSTWFTFQTKRKRIHLGNRLRNSDLFQSEVEFEFVILAHINQAFLIKKYHVIVFFSVSDLQ